MPSKKINLRYLPKALTNKDKQRQASFLQKSKKLYKKGKYYTRPHVASFKSKPSKHVAAAQKLYKVDKIGATPELAKATGCSKSALTQIIRKGEGAYYSSGSNFTAKGNPLFLASKVTSTPFCSAISKGKVATIPDPLV